MTHWEQIVNEYGLFVFRLARRITGRDEDAEDVVQDVFAEIYEYQKREPIREWRGLLRHKATYRALDRIRRRRPAVSIDDVEIASRSHGPVQAAVPNELATQLRSAIAELPRQQAAVFCLRYFDGLSNAEISQSLGITSGAVATALHKAKYALTLVFSEDKDGGS